MIKINRYLLLHVQKLVQVNTTIGEFTESTLLSEKFSILLLQKSKKIFCQFEFQLHLRLFLITKCLSKYKLLTSAILIDSC